MKHSGLNMKTALALVIGGMLAAGPVLAEKPSWAGGGKGGRGERADQRDEQRGEQRNERREGDAKSRREGHAIPPGGHFEQRHREVVREYYTEQFRRGRCPPGLAKKHNGCMPPGQAKKWQLGEPLPRDVVYYDLPPRVVVSLGVPPAGHKYV